MLWIERGREVKKAVEKGEGGSERADTVTIIGESKAGRWRGGEAKTLHAGGECQKIRVPVIYPRKKTRGVRQGNHPTRRGSRIKDRSDSLPPRGHQMTL